MVRIADFIGVMSAISGKIELVYEGEQEGAGNVAYRLTGQAIRSLFTQYFPDPQSFKKKTTSNTSSPVVQRTPLGGGSRKGAYQPIIDWFGHGHELLLLQDENDTAYLQKLYEVDGLHAAVKQFYPKADDAQTALLMEFLLHGLSEFSLISKKGVEAGGFSFGDILGSMINMNFGSEEEEEDF